MEQMLTGTTETTEVKDLAAERSRQLSTSIPEPLLIDLKVLAARKITSLQSEVQEALRSHVEREASKLSHSSPK